MVVLWAGMLVTVAWVIVTGLTHFNAATRLRLSSGPVALRPTHVDRAGDGTAPSRCMISWAITRFATWATKSLTPRARFRGRS